MAGFCSPFLFQLNHHLLQGVLGLTLGEVGQLISCFSPITELDLFLLPLIYLLLYCLPLTPAWKPSESTGFSSFLGIPSPVQYLARFSLNIS